MTTVPSMSDEQQLTLSLQQAAQALSWPEMTVHLDYPERAEFGDYTTNMALKVGSQAGLPASPRARAEQLVSQLQRQFTKNPSSNLWSKIAVEGPGFINFTLKQSVLLKHAQEVAQALNDGSLHAQLVQSGTGKSAVVEYSSPNIAKPFTIGHLRSTVIGNAVANLLEAVGYTVYRDNHLGDWGTQFGKQICAIKHFGDEKVIEQAADPVKELVSLYVRFHEEAEKDPALEDEARSWFKKLEEGDAEARRLWAKCIDWSFKEFQRIYARLDVSFTENGGRGYGESYFEDKMGRVIEKLRSQGLLTKSEGAELIFFPGDALPPLMILKKDGSTLYATRDLATDLFRLEKYGADVLVINEVGAEQSLYLRQVFAVEEMLGWYSAGRRVHVGHGLFRFKDRKMSTRKGNVIWLEEVLDEAVARAKKIGKSASVEDSEVSAAVGIGALKWNDLKRSAHLDVIFDWDEVLSMDGNSGPYMQYTYARCFSVLQKADARHSQPADATSLSPADLQKLTHEWLQKALQQDFSEIDLSNEERAVFTQLYRWNHAMRRAVAEYAPHHVCTYLFALAQSFNAFYHQHAILDDGGQREQSSPTSQTTLLRLLLTYLVGRTLHEGLAILGIKVLSNM